MRTDFRHYLFLHMKARGYSKQVIMNEIPWTSEEYDTYCKTHQAEIETALKDRERYIGCGKEFFKLTSNLYRKISPQVLGKPQPPLFKTAVGERIDLTKEDKDPFLSAILQAANGVQARSDGSIERSYVSDGLCYPLELYLYSSKDTILAQGLYQYLPVENSVAKISDHYEELNEEIKVVLQRPATWNETELVLFWTGVVERSYWRAEERAYRWMLHDAGKSYQKAQIVAEKHNWTVTPIYSYLDELMSQLLDLGDGELPLYAALYHRSR